MKTTTQRILSVIALSLQVSLLGSLSASRLQALEPAVASASANAIPSVQDIIKNPEAKDGQTITFEGFVTGICRNSGKKAFIHDRNREVKSTLRVDCTAGLPPFDQSYVGKSVRVTGKLRVLRIDAAYLDSWEAKITGKPVATKEAGGTDHCTEACSDVEGKKGTLDRITALRARLAKAPKGYLASFWVDGIQCETLNAQ